MSGHATFAGLGPWRQGRSCRSRIEPQPYMRRIDEVEADRAVLERVAGLECAVAQRLGLRMCVDRARRNAREIVGDADDEAVILRPEAGVEAEAVPQLDPVDPIRHRPE